MEHSESHSRKRRSNLCNLRKPSQTHPFSCVSGCCDPCSSRWGSNIHPLSRPGVGGFGSFWVVCLVPLVCVCPKLRGHLTCTDNRAQADEQKIARNEGSLALPAMHLLCMCSMVVSSEFSHLRKRSAKKLHFCTFPGFPSISESTKKLQKLFGSALSHLRICHLFVFCSGDCSGGPQGTLGAPL